jgi:hypothetical protein
VTVSALRQALASLPDLRMALAIADSPPSYSASHSARACVSAAVDAISGEPLPELQGVLLGSGAVLAHGGEPGSLVPSLESHERGCAALAPPTPPRPARCAALLRAALALLAGQGALCRVQQPRHTRPPFPSGPLEQLPLAAAPAGCGRCQCCCCGPHASSACSGTKRRRAAPWRSWWPCSGCSGRRRAPPTAAQRRPPRRAQRRSSCCATTRSAGAWRPPVAHGGLAPLHPLLQHCTRHVHALPPRAGWPGLAVAHAATISALHQARVAQPVECAAAAAAAALAPGPRQPAAVHHRRAVARIP